MKLITRILLSALVLVFVAYIVPGIEVAGIYTAIIAALILGLLNGVVRPILIVLTFPITLLTLGLFIFIINAGLFLFAASFIDGFVVDGFLPALLGSLIMSIVGTAANKFIA